MPPPPRSVLDRVRDSVAILVVACGDMQQATKTVERWVLSHPLPNFNNIVAKVRRERFRASEPHDAGMYKSPDNPSASP